MTVVWGGTLAAGILLALAPWLWPADRTRAPGAADGRLRRLLDTGGYAHAPTAALVLVSLGFGAFTAAVSSLFVPLPSVLTVAGAFGAWAPLAWLRRRARALRRSRRALWPDVCELLISSVRAGMPLPEALAALAVIGPEPLRPAFGRFAADFAASGHFDAAALRAKAALGDPVGDRIIETLRMARQVGGTELTAVLRALAASVRAEAALRGEVEARQSWIRGAAVVGVAAPWLVLGLLAMRPEGARAYASPEGAVLVLAGAGVSVVAYQLMLRMGRLPEPRRWLA
jgi:Flp pilus assembly protein TadB